MSDSVQRPVKPRAGRTPTGRRRVRRALSAAAVELFVARGYESTTVDEIAERAGVGRRTFFRYFRSKEDAIFPDHDEILAVLEEFFDGAEDRTPPFETVCEAAELVLATYEEDPDLSLERFRLTRTVPSLRDREIASTDRYQRIFSRFLRKRLAGEPDAELVAAVTAAAVVAAHNHVLRQWLKDGARGDLRGAARNALRFVGDAFAARHGRQGRAPTTARAEGGEVVVAALRTSAPLQVVVRQFEEAARQLGSD